MKENSSLKISNCPDCGSQVPETVLYCPSCQRLTYLEQLKSMSGEADAALSGGDIKKALEIKRHMLQLLPPQTRQAEVLNRQVLELVKTIDSGPKTSTGARKGWAKIPVGLGVVGLLFWKFKFVLLLVLGKLKFLLLGFTKIGTILTMFASLALYWKLYGWAFGIGLVLSLYVHEMGHVAMLARYGVKATAPMFIPGFGAVVLLKEKLVSRRQDAMTGLAGPMWGLGAALATLVAYFITGWGALAAIAAWGAKINLFNLMPVWQLDGARGFRGLTRKYRFILMGLGLLCWMLTGEHILLFIAAIGLFVCFTSEAAEENDTLIFSNFALLLVSLAAIGMYVDKFVQAGLTASQGM